MVADSPGYVDVDGLGIALVDGILRIHLDRAEKRNALGDGMIEAFGNALDEANRDERVRVVLITAAGDHFCGGADIVARNADKDAPRPRVGSIQRRLPSLAHRLVSKIIEVQVPVVAAVRGTAAGIGLNIATAADFCVAANDATFWAPFSARGFTPDSAATWLLPRAVGPVVARRLLLLGERVSGERAAEIGLVHDAVETARVDEVATSLADKLASGPTVALGLTKWLVHAGASATLPEHLQHEALALELSSRSEDFREGMAAFAERRDTEFTGR